MTIEKRLPYLFTMRGVCIWVLTLMLYLMSFSSSWANTNNPANLEKHRELWKGEVQCKNERFSCFSSQYWGIRAAILNLRTYYVTHGLTTIEDIIHRWAPTHENETEEYIRFVVDNTGIARDIDITFSPTSISKVVVAMMERESGNRFNRKFVELIFRKEIEDER